MIVRYPALALRPYQRTWKDMPVPVVVETPMEDYGGCYYQPEKGEALICGRHISTDRGVIVIATTSDDGTVAHEWRHHWQSTNQGMRMNSGPYWQKWCQELDYYKAIERYFLTLDIEWDAFCFTLSKVRQPRPECEWLDALPSLQRKLGRVTT